MQSRATADSTLAQYRVGKVTFASVLEANAGYINDEESFLAAVADAQRIAIAAAEVSLEAARRAERGRDGWEPSARSGPGGRWGRRDGHGCRRGLRRAGRGSSSAGSMTSGM